jgi:hypothetical protein
MKDRKMKKTISGIIGNGEYLQPDMVIENNGMMWRFNKKWLNGVVDEILDVLENKIDQAKQEERERIIKLLESFYPEWSDNDVNIRGNMRLSGKYKNIKIELLDRILKEL